MNLSLVQDVEPSLKLEDSITGKETKFTVRDVTHLDEFSFAYHKPNLG